ncbi:MAG: DMT family transporter [Planctomycetota bacterium]
MPTTYLGETCALAAAFTWATALVLFKRSGEHVPPLTLNLFKNYVAIFLLSATLLPMWLLQSPDPSDGPLSWGDHLLLLISGALGITLADTMLLYALNLVGVGLVTVAECTYSPLVFLFAFLMHAEPITRTDLIGGGLVLSGVFLSSTHKPPANRTRGQILLGSGLAVAAIALVSFAILLAKPVLVHTSLLSATLVRLLGGTVLLTLFLLASPNRRQHFAVFKPSRTWWTTVPAAVTGTYLSMVFWIGGFKWAKASVAAILNQSSTIIALILASVILKESFTRRKVVAAVLAITGVVVVARG